MQCSEYQVSGFSSRQRKADGFEISKFAHQNDVRILTQCTAQRVVERQGMRADFALVDEAFFAFVHKLDRVFHRQNVTHLVLVDVVDHGGERGGLSRTGGTCHQHHAARVLGDLLEDHRSLEFLQGQHLGRDGPHDRPGSAVLDKGIDTKTGQVGNRKGEVALEVFLVELALTIVHDVVDHGVHVLVFHGRQIDAPDVAMHPDHRRKTGGKMQVGSLVLNHKREELSNVHQRFSGDQTMGTTYAGGFGSEQKCSLHSMVTMKNASRL